MSKKFSWSDKFSKKKLNMNVSPEQHREMAAQAATNSAITTFEHWGYWLCEEERELIAPEIEKVILQFLKQKSDRSSSPTDNK